MIPYTRDQDSLCNASKAYANRSAAASSEIRRKPTSRPADSGWVHRQTRQRRIRAAIILPTRLLTGLCIALLGCSAARAGAGALEGELIGQLTAADEAYTITSTISVPYGETATISSGATLCFSAGAMLVVEGFLVTEGKKGKPVTFSSCDPGKRWGGIRFRSSKRVGERINRLEYSIIEYADRTSSAKSATGSEGNGGGLAFEDSDAEIVNSTVRFNSAVNGGGIYVAANSNVKIVDSGIYSNKATGSNYIYSGGGGLYFDALPDAKVGLQRSWVVLNEFVGNNYANEEGGGGLYLHGGDAFVGFNLFLANRSGKGPAALINALAPKGASGGGSAPFYGNLVIANQGGFNFEQVAVQTRYSFESAGAPDVWEANSGQLPFVAHLNRNSLVRYLNYGHRLDLPQAKGDDRKLYFDRFLANARRPRAHALALLQERSVGAPTCGQEVLFGPVAFCHEPPPGLQSYLDRLSDALDDPILSGRVRELLGEGSDQLQRERAVQSLDFADRIAKGDPPSRLPEIFAKVVEGSASPAELISDLRVGKSTDSRGLSPALWAFSVGQDELFDNMLSTASYEDREKLLQQAAMARFEDASLRILAADSGRKTGFSRRQLYNRFIDACRAGHSRLVRALLDRGLDPNVPYMGQYAIAAAAEAGHVETVMLLLRRGASPAPPKADPPNLLGRPLDAALSWYHLGGGFREIAELLIAAGAEIDPAGRPPDERLDPLRLKSWVAAGFSKDDPRWPSLLAEASQATDEYLRSIYRSLSGGQVQVDPVIANIRKWRSQTLADLANAIESAENQQELIALFRIIQSRRFNSDEALARTLWSKYDSSRFPFLVQSVRLEAVLTLYQDGPVDSVKSVDLLASKGATPNPKPADANGPRDLPYNRKIAVVVGVADYKYLPARSEVSSTQAGLVDLQFADKDAADVAGLIREGGLGRGWEVVDLVGAKAGHRELEAALATFGAVQEDDLVLFFFSGHGFKIPGAPDQVFLLLHDSDLQNLDSTALRLKHLREWALRLKARHVVLILDACHAGLVGNAKGDFSDFSYSSLEAQQKNFEAGKIALTSNLGGALSFEDVRNGNGFFTRVLIQVIKGTAVRRAGANYLSVREIIDTMTRMLPEAVRNELVGATQTPDYIWLQGSDLLDFPLVPLL